MRSTRKYSAAEHLYLRWGKINCLTHRFARFKFSTAHSVHEQLPFFALTLALLPAVLNYDVRIKTRDTKMAIKWNLMRNRGRNSALLLCSREIFLSPLPSPRNYTRAKYGDYYSVIKQTCFLECHSANIISQRGVLSLCKISFVLFARAFAKICVFHAGERKIGRGREGERAPFYNQIQRVLSGKTPIISVVITRVFPAHARTLAHVTCYSYKFLERS